MMEISARRGDDGAYILQLGNVEFDLPEDAVDALYEVVDQRLHHAENLDDENLKEKITFYHNLATKIAGIDDRLVQKFAPKVSAEQLVTIARLAEGDVLYNKILRNLSRQNRRQFEDDYAHMDKITEQHACYHMEQMVPLIKQAAAEHKALQDEIRQEQVGELE
ncbi:FliG C-terminal domain-containing protein [Thiomicrorhabdus sp.]|uniref:FliG C-terminal domain-containing protein n=1 Tax=Thiomicrorhabdus sp. TaxID=2039724 RepID=UPI0029C82406|nr:FliG C-terminal domain-containing protein [Thiomicrorhabdus sp.]